MRTCRTVSLRQRLGLGGGGRHSRAAGQVRERAQSEEGQGRAAMNEAQAWRVWGAGGQHRSRSPRCRMPVTLSWKRWLLPWCKKKIDVYTWCGFLEDRGEECIHRTGSND